MLRVLFTSRLRLLDCVEVAEQQLVFREAGSTLCGPEERTEAAVAHPPGVEDGIFAMLGVSDEAEAACVPG